MYDCHPNIPWSQHVQITDFLLFQFDAPPDSFKKQAATSVQLPTSASTKDMRTAKGSISVVKKTEKLHKKKSSEKEDKDPGKEEKEQEEEGEGGERQLTKLKLSGEEKLERTRSSDAMTPSTPDEQLSLPPTPAAATPDGKEAEVMEDSRKAEDSLVVINRQAEQEEQKVRELWGCFVVTGLRNQV